MRELVLLTRSQLAAKEVGDMHPERMCNQQEIRVLRVPLGALVALDRPPLHAGEVRQLLL